MNKYINHRILPLLIVFLLTSCGVVTKTYKKPDKTVTNNLYRDAGSTDSTSLADMPWRELFTDSILQQLIEEGLNQNPDLQSALERMNQAKASLTKSKLSLLPSVSGSADVTHTKLSEKATQSTNLYSTVWEAGIGASWELDIWGKLTSSKKAALAAYLQTDAARRGVQTALIANIANTYYTLLALDKQLDITRETVKYRLEEVESMKLMKEAAIVNGAAFMQSQANLYAAEVSIPDLEQSIRETENALCIVLGRVPGSIKRGALAEQTAQTNLTTGVPSQLLNNRPDVLEAELAIREAFEYVNVARASFYPSLTITANGGLSSFNISDFFNNALFYNLVGGLTQPLFKQGQLKANLIITKSQQQEAYNTFKTTLLTAGEEVSNALYAYQMAEKKEISRTKQLEALEQAVTFTKELLQYTSSTNYTDVLTSEQSLLSTQLSSVSDQLQKLQAIVDLYKALGGGWK